MEKRSRKKSQPRADRNQKVGQPRIDRAALIAELDQIISEVEGTGKDPLAVLFSRRGAKKGGLARMAKLTQSERIESARRAARARWDRRKK